MTAHPPFCVDEQSEPHIGKDGDCQCLAPCCDKDRKCICPDCCGGCDDH